MTDITVEEAAKAIYFLMPYDGPAERGKPDWVEGGNSHTQQEARNYARAAIAAARRGLEREDDWLVLKHPKPLETDDVSENNAAVGSIGDGAVGAASHVLPLDIAGVKERLLLSFDYEALRVIEGLEVHITELNAAFTVKHNWDAHVATKAKAEIERLREALEPRNGP